MRFTWGQSALFFILLALVAWIIYPNKYFLGQMNRNNPDRTKAIQYFNDYLKSHPHHKGTLLSLAEVYESVADPSSSASVLKTLYGHRAGDLETGRRYLELLERSGSSEEAIKFQWEFYQSLKEKEWVEKKVLEELLYSYYQKALVLQDEEKEIQALRELQRVAKVPGAYRFQVVRYHLDKHQFKEAATLLQSELASDPKNLETRLALISVLRLAGKSQESLSEIEKGQAYFPNDPDLTEQKVSLYESRGQHLLAAEALQRFLQNQTGRPELKKRLAYNLLKGGKGPEALLQYEQIVQSDPLNRESWLDLIYALDEMGKDEEAVAQLVQYLKRFPDDSEGIDLLVYKYEKMNQPDLAAAVLEGYLKQDPLDFKRSWRLAQLLAQAGKTDRAELVYFRLIEMNPNQKKVWQELIYIYTDGQQTSQAIEWLEKFLTRFTGDEEALDTLVYLLEREGERDRAIERLKHYLEQNPGNEKQWLALANLLEDQKRWQDAESVYLRFYKNHPDQSRWLIKLAQVNQQMGLIRQSQRYYEEWLALDEQDPEILKEIGEESFFSGFTQTAQVAFERAETLAPDGEVHFYLSEIHFSKKEARKAQAHAQRSLELLPQGESPALVRMRLKMDGRAGWNKEDSVNYRKWTGRFPDDLQLLNDWIDFLFENQQFAEAEEALLLLEQRFPAQKKMAQRYQIHLALQKNEWQKAIDLFSAGSSSETVSDEYRTDLAQAYWRTGDWRKAHALLTQSTGTAALQDSAEPGWAKEMLSAIAEQYGNHLGSSFRVYELSNEKTIEAKINYRQYLSRSFQLSTQLQQNRYEVSSGLSDSQAVEGQIKMSYDLSPDFRIAALGGNTWNSPRDQLYPGFSVMYRSPEKWMVNAEGRYHRLWNDFASAVSQGVSADEFQVSVEGGPWKRWSGSVRVLAAAYETSSLSKARRTQFSPELFYRIWDQPDCSVSYQYFYDRLNGDQSFFDTISLIQDSQIHFLSGHWNRWFRAKTVHLGAYVYNGYDARRNLNFFEGDLLGAIFKVQWKFFSWLNGALSYQYSREAASGISGESQMFSFNIEGWWVPNGKKNISDR